MSSDSSHLQRISQALSAAGMGVWDWDIRKDELVLDAYLFDLYGLEREKFRGKIADWRSILHPKSSDWAEGELGRLMQESDEFSTSYQIQRPIDGREAWLGTAGRVIRDEKGEPARMIGISWDRTKQVKLEKSVGRAYEFIKGILNSISDPIFVKNKDHRWVFFNDAFAELIGSERDELLGKSDFDFFPKEVAEHFWKIDDQVFSEKREIEVEEPAPTKEGYMRYLLTKKRPIYDLETDEHMLLGVIRDITQRRRSEMELRNLHQLVESSNDIFAVFNLDCTAEYSNSRARETFGLTPGGKSIREIMSPAHLETLMKVGCARAKSGSHWQGQLDFYSLEEGAIPVAVSLFGIVESDNQVKSLALIGKDMREQVKAQRLLMEQSKMAALGQLAGGIAHEINNPLAAVRGRLYLLRLALEDPSKSVDPKTLLDEILGMDRLTVRISEIVNALKVFSRKDPSPDLARVPLGEVVREVVSVSSEKLRTCEAEVELKIPQDLFVQARRVDLMQILVNLLNNSCDAISLLKERWIKIEARSVSNSVELTVTDSGRGIPDAIVKRMMEPFFTTKDVGQGTGLGLSISRSLAENMGGSLDYDSSSAHTRFVLRLI